MTRPAPPVTGDLSDPGLRRLAALAAALVPGRAERLLALAGGRAAPRAAAAAAALASRPRPERLEALALAVAAGPHAADPGRNARSPLLRRLLRDAALRR